MALLSVDELLKYAVLIEENGEAFYRYWASRTKNPNQKKIFDFLADEEADHKTTFKGMSDQLKSIGYQPEGIDNQQYTDYLEAVSREVLFNIKNFDEETKDIADLRSALEFAIKKELDSVIFYSDLKKYLPLEHVEVMDKIIVEEQNHQKKLEDLREELFANEIK